MNRDNGGKKINISILPYHCENRNEKWRLIKDETGNIAKNDSGTAVDGGGHDTKKGCKNKAQTILANEHS